jgi:hypothetical protein
MLILPHKFKKYVNLQGENQGSMVNVVHDSEHR